MHSNFADESSRRRGVRQSLARRDGWSYAQTPRANSRKLGPYVIVSAIWSWVYEHMKKALPAWRLEVEARLRWQRTAEGPYGSIMKRWINIAQVLRLP
jgi:hypothetical protein